MRKRCLPCLQPVNTVFFRHNCRAWQRIHETHLCISFLHPSQSVDGVWWFVADIWEGKMDDRSAMASLNPQCTQMICRKGESLSVHQLDLDDSPPSLSLVFTQRPFEPGTEEREESDIDVSWAPSGAFAAITFMTRDFEDSRSDNDTGIFSVVYVWDASAQSLAELLCTDPESFAAMSDPVFSPSGHQLIVPWSISGDPHMLWDVYNFNHGRFERSASVRDAQDYAFLHVVAPSGHHYAVEQPGGANVYDSSSHDVESYRVDTEAEANGKVQLAFSPDSSQLGVYLKISQTNSAICLFDTASHDCKMMAGPATQHKGVQPQGLSVSFTSVVALCGLGLSDLHLFSIKQQTFGKQLLVLKRRQIDSHTGFSELAISPDGIFLAVICQTDTGASVEHELRVYEMAAGRLLHSYQAPHWCIPKQDKRPWYMHFTLRWAPSSGLRLLVGERLYIHAKYRDDSEEVIAEGTDTEKVTVFSF